MKKFLLFLLGLVVVTIVGGAIFLATFDLNSYRDTIVAKATEALGRPVKISSLHLKKSLIPTIEAKGIVIDSPDGLLLADKPLLKVDSLEATLAIVPLFSKKIEIQGIALGNATINLIEQNGKNNWTFTGSKDRRTVKRVNSLDEKEQWLNGLRVDSISSKNVSLTYRKNTDEKYLNVSDLSIKQLKVFSLTATLNGIPFKISGTVNSVLDLIQKKPDYLFNVDLNGADLNIKLSGSIGDTQNFKNLLLNVALTGNNLKRTLERFGVSNRVIPAQSFTGNMVFQGDLNAIQANQFQLLIGGNKLRFDGTGELTQLLVQPEAEMTGTIAVSDRVLGELMGVQPFAAEMKLGWKQGIIIVKNIAYTAGRTDIQAAGFIDLNGQKPAVDIKLNSDYFDIQEVLARSDRGSSTPVAKAASTNKIPDTPVDIGFLNMLDANVSFLLPHMKISDAFQDYLGMGGTLVIKNGTLTINPLKIEMLNGGIVGQVQAQASAQNSFIANLDGNGLQLNMIKAMPKYVKGATLNFSSSLRATGKSLKQILSTLTGRISMEVPQGTVVYPKFYELADALGVINKSSVTYSTTDRESQILCGAINLNLNNGETKGDKQAAIETSNINFIVGGTVNLPQETLDINMIPSVNIKKKSVNNKLQMAGKFVKITGTFADPTPDVAWDKVAQDLLQRVVGGTQKVQSPQPYQLCREVLGRKPISQVQEDTKKTQMLPEPKPIVEPTPQKLPNDFQQQLMESITKALK